MEDRERLSSEDSHQTGGEGDQGDQRDVDHPGDAAFHLHPLLNHVLSGAHSAQIRVDLRDLLLEVVDILLDAVNIAGEDADLAHNRLQHTRVLSQHPILRVKVLLEPVEALTHLVEALTHLVKAIIGLVEAMIDPFEALIHLVKAVQHLRVGASRRDQVRQRSRLLLTEASFQKSFVIPQGICDHAELLRSG